MSIQINIGDHKSPYAPLLVPVPLRHQFATKWARRRAKEIAATVKSADKHRGMRPELSNEIGIGELAYVSGKEMVLATLIHELAHIAGASDGRSRAAEEALIHCGLGKKSELETGIKRELRDRAIARPNAGGAVLGSVSPPPTEPELF